jgi:opacity protein-like surface antigen
MHSKKVLAVLLLSLAACSAATANEAGVTATSKLGQFTLDADGLDHVTAAGLSFGYDFGNTWTVEFEHLKSRHNSTGYGAIDINTAALYAVYRSEGAAYLLGKFGYLNEKLDALNGHKSEDSHGASYGLGTGYRFNKNVSIELEYTIIEADIKFLGLGLRGKY